MGLSTPISTLWVPYPFAEKLYNPHGEPHHLSTISVKDYHLFKIVESIFSFYLKLHNFK